MSVIKLSKKWKLTELCSRASANSERYMITKSSIDKIVNGKKFGVETWLKQGFREICSRTKAVTRDEKAQLDLSTYIDLLELRDRITEWTIENSSFGLSVRQREDFDYDVALTALFSGDRKEDVPAYAPTAAGEEKEVDIPASAPTTYEEKEDIPASPPSFGWGKYGIPANPPSFDRGKYGISASPPITGDKKQIESEEEAEYPSKAALKKAAKKARAKKNAGNGIAWYEF
jgi:hypothetical protein